MSKKIQERPEFMCWGGGGVARKWSFGWWTGRDGDLLCVVPKVLDPKLGMVLLSPVCDNRILAFTAFLVKRILLKLDANWGAGDGPIGSEDTSPTARAARG